MCTWGVLPSSRNLHPASYARSHAALVRTCRRLYQALNRALYLRNLKQDPLTASCLLWAVNVGNIDTVKRAHMFGAALDSSIEVTAETTYCPPWGVIEPDPEDSLYHLPYQFSFIHVAILRRHVAVVQYLLENGVDVHAPSLNFCCGDWNYSDVPLFPLHQCLFHDGINRETSAIEWEPLKDEPSSLTNNSTPALINLLVSKGAYLLVEDLSAVSKLSSEGYDDLAKQLLNRSDEVSLWAGLHFAASTNDLPLATDLIQRGADAAATTYDGETALHFAAESCKNDIGLINLLLRQPNVDPRARDFYEDTPLHFASGASNSEVVRLLLQQPSVSVNGARRDGRTALHLACLGPYTDASLATVQHLIDAGAPLDVFARNIGTPLRDALELEEFRIDQLIWAGRNPWQVKIRPQRMYDIHGRAVDFPKSEPKLFLEKENIISLLIDSGAQLGQIAGSSPPWLTALGYAFAVDQLGNTALLDLLLRLSTSRNIEKQFLDDFIDKSTKTAADSRVKLLAFRARLFS
ncbi:unnamed protein product [Clonostachys rhizophaga]|uniref:Uncharacterized protein n=1 Tax=Clonostachys rhizophaga TaxID=160324 RepID=A0A9N9VQQ1_9HYPO|nr:unnamed protein product [Clonostachys rhizophaga]